jgi:cell division protein ZapA
MTENTKLPPISINILGKDYRIACSEEEQEGLIRSAQELDEQMREIRDKANVNGTDRIAVMAALNLAHEIHQMQAKKSVGTQSNISEKLANLRHKIEHALENF